MPSTTTLVAFAIASIVLVVIPGPAVFYILGRGVAQGRRAAVVSTFGVENGTLIHVLAAAIGLSAIISSSALAYDTLRYAGVGYLFFLGIKTLRSSPDHESPINPTAADSARKTYLQGVLVQVLIPKVTIFFLAFLPQFVEPGDSQTLQILVLGSISLVIATISDLMYAFFSGLIGGSMRRRPAINRIQRYIAAATYLGLAALGAVNGGRRTAC